MNRAEVKAAAARIRSWVRRTPVIEAGGVVFKLEHLQHTGSFKPRGMFNRLLSADVPAMGIVIASGGNAGLAAAYAAKQLGHPSTVFVPETAPVAKIDRLRAVATEVRLAGSTYADALVASLEYETSTGALGIHAYDQIAVVAGQGTIALELEAQAPQIDTLLVAVGGGGLIGGIAAAYEGRIKVVAVETEGCPTLRAALDAGEPVDVEVGGIAADSLGAQRIGEACWSVRRHIAASVLVSDEAVRAAQDELWETMRQVTEPGGATAFAALAAGAYEPARSERVGVVICGANTSLVGPA